MPDDRFLHLRAGHSHKVNLLSDLEYRVWTQYLISADDFGVMRASAVTLQAGNDRLASLPERKVGRALETVIDSKLLRTFTHQQRRYVYQTDWQKWQKVEYPRATDNPKPDEAAMEFCDELTAALFLKHPGGTRSARTSRERPEGVPNDLEKSATTRACVPAKRLTANGIRLAANGSEGSLRETDSPPMDRWLLQLQAEYPPNRVTRGFMTSSLFFEQLSKCGPELVAERFALMLRNLANQKAGHEWRVKGMIPGLEKWLREGLWLNEHPAEAPVAEQLGARVNRTLSAAAAIMREPD